LPVITQAVSNFVLIPILLKALGERAFGIYAMLYSIAQFTSFGVGWLGGVAIRLIGLYEARNNQEKLQEVTLLVFYYFLFYGFIISIAGIFISQFFNLESNIRSAVFLLALYLFFNYILQAIINILFSYNLQFVANIIRTLPTIIYTLLSLLMLEYWKQEIIVPFLALLISVVIMLPVVLKYFFRFGLFNNPFKIDKETIKEVFLYVGFWNFLYGLLLVSLMQDRIFLGFFISPESAAKFTVLWTIPNFFYQILWKIIGVSQPYYVRFYEKNLNMLKKLFLVNTLLASLIAFGFSIVYAFYGKKIVYLWTGTVINFTLSKAFLFAGILTFIVVLEKVFSLLFFPLGRYKYLIISLLVVFIIKYIGAIFILDFAGEVSIVLSSIMGFLIVFLMHIFYFTKMFLRRGSI